jgi:hypothetical protein
MRRNSGSKLIARLICAHTQALCSLKSIEVTVPWRPVAELGRSVELNYERYAPEADARRLLPPREQEPCRIQLPSSNHVEPRV